MYLRNGFLRPRQWQSHTHTANSSRMQRPTTTKPYITWRHYSFFSLPHFHLKTIHSRWKMTRELRCNKWKFQIVVPFLWSAQRAFFDVFSFLSSLDGISGLCYYFNSLFSENSFFKRQRNSTAKEKDFFFFSINLLSRVLVVKISNLR